MIYIVKNSNNIFDLTLSELTDDIYFLFQFVYENNYDIEPIYFTTPDISDFKRRYNRFILEDSNTGSTTGGDNIELNLKNGQYIYNVYSSATIIHINNIDLNSMTLIETGRMVVEGVQTNIDPRYN